MAPAQELSHSEPARKFAPIVVKTGTFHRAIEPVSYDCAIVIVVRDGSAVLLSEFGTRHIRLGDVAVLAANTLCGAEPEEFVTTTTLYQDRNYVVDQVFWQYADQFVDRLAAKDFVDNAYIEPAQTIRLGEDRAGSLMPWLDELTALCLDGPPPPRFYRVQSLLFAVLDVLAPYVTTTSRRVSSTQRHTASPSSPGHRQFVALREEARATAALLRSDPTRRWTLAELASAVHLSQSQLGRIFVDAFGKTPIAYLAMLRVERMARLLRSTDMPVAKIATEVGWEDPDFASRQFRRSVGITPSRFRTMGRERDQDRRVGLSG